MKRKASALEDSHTAAEWPSFDYSSSASTASPESVKAAAEHGRTMSHCNRGAVPYFNSRTQKRYRDNRPNEETIHQNTLAKLYNAQKHAHLNDNGSSDHPDLSTTSSTQLCSDNSSGASPWQAPNIALGLPERNQRSIDSFFGSSSRATVHSKATQPRQFCFHSTRDTEQSISRCEDCSTVLSPATFVSDTDAMCMDRDLQHDEWACASCSRRVCDTCAVRGDLRICLECAVPGGGQG